MAHILFIVYGFYKSNHGRRVSFFSEICLLSNDCDETTGEGSHHMDVFCCMSVKVLDVMETEAAEITNF